MLCPVRRSSTNDTPDLVVSGCNWRTHWHRYWPSIVIPPESTLMISPAQSLPRKSANGSFPGWATSTWVERQGSPGATVLLRLGCTRATYGDPPVGAYRVTTTTRSVALKAWISEIGPGHPLNASMPAMTTSERSSCCRLRNVNIAEHTRVCPLPVTLVTTYVGAGVGHLRFANPPTPGLGLDPQHPWRRARGPPTRPPPSAAGRVADSVSTSAGCSPPWPRSRSEA